MGMKIYFIETERPERDYFVRELEGNEVHFVAELDEVPAETEILSIFIYCHIDASFLVAHPSLKLIVTRSTTWDHIDLAACSRLGVTVCNIGSYGDYTVAEHTFAMILALARRLRELAEASKSLDFSYETMRSFELRSRTLGVIGTGHVGMHVIRLAKSFGMRVIANDIVPRSEEACSLDFRYVTLDELLQQSDIITLHATLKPETYHLMDTSAFAKCRPGVIIVNTSRGALIDTRALIEALDTGIVSGAGLDVLENEMVMHREASDIISDQIVKHIQEKFVPTEARVQDPKRVRELQDLMYNESLLSRHNVVFTPHVAFNTVEAVQRIHQMTIENIQAFAAGHPINVLTSDNSLCQERKICC